MSKKKNSHQDLPDEINDQNSHTEIDEKNPNKLTPLKPIASRFDAAESGVERKISVSSVGVVANEATSTSSENKEPTSNSLLQSASLNTYAAATGIDDPKEYQYAPFVLNKDSIEQIGLNSGNLGLSFTDFVLPGKNGFDLAVTRQYNSSMSNEVELTPNYKRVNTYTWIIKFVIRGYDEITQRTLDINYEIYNGDNYYAHYEESKQAADDYWEEYSLEFERGQVIDCEDTNGDYHRVRISHIRGVKKVVSSAGIQDIVTSATRPNDHLIDSYGLGLGWGFGFPSMEVVKEQYKVGRNKVRFYNFLHLGDGRVYKISGNQLEDYELKDIIFSSRGGVIKGRGYSYTVTYKDGKTAYFYKESEDSIRLTAMTDRFENMIAFNLGAGGGSIVDTLGRTIYLNKSPVANGYTLTWSLPDGASVAYTIQNGLLTSVSDQIGRTTSYGYTSKSLFKSFTDGRFGDEDEKIPFRPLSSVKYPTGATSEYDYVSYENKYGTLNGTQSMLLTSKTVDYEKNEEEKNLKTYKYDISYKSKNNGYNVSIYVKSSTVTASETEDKYYFDYQKPLNKHVTKVGGVAVRERNIPTYAHVLLPTKETVKRYQNNKSIETETNWSYDIKGNMLSETVPIKGTVTIMYDATYCTPVQKIYYRDDGIKIREDYELRPDKRVVEWKKVYETKNGAEALVEATEYKYDTDNNLSSERRCADFSAVSSDDLVSAFSYNNKNPSLGAEYNGVYLSEKRIVGIKDVNGAVLPDIVESYVCDSLGRVLEKTDPTGKQSKYEFDAIGRPKKEFFPKNNPTDFSERQYFKEIQYSNEQNHIIETDEEGNQKRNEYTSLGKIERVYALNPDTLLFHYTYDSKQRLSCEYSYSTEGSTYTQYAYDAFDRILSKYTSGAKIAPYEEKYSYDDTFDTARQYSKETKEILGNSSNAPSVFSHVLRDVLGRTREEAVGSANIVTEYDYQDNKKSQTDPRFEAVSAWWSYDYTGRVLTEARQAELGIVSSAVEYSPLGNKRWARDCRGKYTYFTFDAAGRLLEQKADFSGSEKMITRYAYDPVGNITVQKVLSAAGRYMRTTYTYDSRYRVLDTIMNDGKSETRSRVTYDGCGNQKVIYTGMLGAATTVAAKTTYTYDRFGNMKSTTDPIGNSPNPTEVAKRTEHYSYDDYGKLRSKTDRNGCTTSYSYDGIGRVLKETVIDPSGESPDSYRAFTYFKNGFKETEKNDNATVNFVYDNMGRVVSQNEVHKVGIPEQAAVTRVNKSYSYDQCGNRKTFVMQKDGTSHISLSYDYDRQNRLKGVYRNGKLMASYVYDENGNRIALTYPQSQITTECGYNDANLVLNLYNKKNGVHRSSYHYSYFPDGNQSQKISKVSGKADKTTDYKYDLLGRLTEESEAGGDRVVYEYDRFQNRQKMTVTDVNGKLTITDYRYDLRNRLQTETKLDSKDAEETLTYRYDYNGNQVRREWERFSPKAEKKTPGRIGFTSGKFKEDIVILERREYNGFNELVYLYRDGYETRYSYRPDGLRQKKEFADGTTLTHIWDGQNIVAEYNQNWKITARYHRGISLIAREQDNLSQYYLFNAHGDVVERTDQNGTTLKNYDYDAFGVEKNPEHLDANPFRYCGEYFDREADTIYLRARHYCPTTGGFGAEDPIRSGLNWYTYCGGNPLMFVDPSGLVYKPSSEKYRKQVDSYLGTKALRISQKESTITLYARFSVTGNIKDNNIANTKTTYKQAALNGIVDSWNGKYKDNSGINKTVSVVLIEVSSGSDRKHFNINIDSNPENKNSHVAGISKGGIGKTWSPDNIGNIMMYDNNPLYAKGRISTVSEFSKTTGHEFGHVLGIADAYFLKDDGKWSHYAPNLTSIMNDQYTANGAQNVDYAKMLQAQEIEKWTAWR